MYARVMRGQLGKEKIEDFERMIRGLVLPRARELDGFKGGYWLADRETGSVIGITMFDSEEALRASAEQADRIRQESSREAGLPEPEFASYEVVVAVGEGLEAEKAA